MLTARSWNYPLALAVRQATRQYWLPQRVREKMARVLFHPSRQVTHPFRVRLDRLVYRGDFREYLDWRVFFLGSFERETVNLCRFLAGHVRHRAFLDIGANKGLFSLLLAGRFDRVVAVEPLSGNIAKMELAMAENGIRSIEIARCALGDADGMAEFTLPPAGNEGIGSLVPGHVTNPSGTTLIPVRRGAALCEELELRPGLLKIDTEGYEAAVLRGLLPVLRRDRPFLVMEIGESSKAALAAGGGVMAHLPEDYVLLEVAEASTVRDFFLTPLAEEEMLARTISNNLACPGEHLPLLGPYIRPRRR